MRLLYYLEAKGDEEQRLAFPDVARFLHTNVANNPLLSSYLDDEMKEQIEALQSMLDVAPAEPKKSAVSNQKSDVSHQPSEELADTTVPVRETIAPLTINPAMMAIDEDSVEMPSVEVEKIAVVPFIERLNATQTSAISVEMRKLTDTAAIRLPMSVKEMSIFIGSTQIQTQLVYGYAPGKAKKLTPLEYVHLLVDDLFQRKGLAGMISDEQRTLLGQRAYLMDLADKNASLTPKALDAESAEYTAAGVWYRRFHGRGVIGDC